jgi:hypothetical protein
MTRSGKNISNTGTVAVKPQRGRNINSSREQKAKTTGQQRIWKIITLSRTFTVDQVAYEAQVCRNSTSSYISKLARTGYIICVDVATRTSPATYKLNVKPGHLAPTRSGRDRNASLFGGKPHRARKTRQELSA